jgi:hypothetical protein
MIILLAFLYLLVGIGGMFLAWLSHFGGPNPFSNGQFGIIGLTIYIVGFGFLFFAELKKSPGGKTFYILMGFILGALAIAITSISVPS